jgi:hypothetical protein
MNDPRSPSTSTADTVAAVAETLGSRLVAYIARVHDTRTISDLATGNSMPAPDVLARLVAAQAAASIITARDSASTAQSWFQGGNPQLGERAPARLLRDLPLEEAAPAVIAAARHFATNGWT